MTNSYRSFIEAKVKLAPTLGFEISDSEMNPALEPHQRAIVRWMVSGGRRACFASFGLGKTVIQLETVRLTRAHAGGRGLIVCPLNVRHEFREQAVNILGWEKAPEFIRNTAEASDPNGLYLTNFESVREGKIDPKAFRVASLDEASVLRGFGGTKTFREFMKLFAGDDRSGQRTEGVPYRFVATATPSPNEFIELLCYSAYLDVMQVSEAKTRFFKRNSEKADELTLHPHKEREFWMWVASWGLFVQKPSDIDPSFSDEGYDLPPLEVHWHEIPTNHALAGEDKSGQARMFKAAAIGVVDAAREKRDSLGARVEKMVEILGRDQPDTHRILWHDLEDERRAIELAIPEAVSIYGSQDLEAREQAILDFGEGRFKYLAAKPVIAGSGCNFQRHCHAAIFLGIGFKFNDFIQACHRIRRFLQQHPVRIDLIYTEAERQVRHQLEEKWARHDELVEAMTGIIREYGLASSAMAHALRRTSTVERVEASGDGYRLINNDSVDEAWRLPSDSVDLIVTSIPFSTQYEYTPSYLDMGHTDSDEHFFEHLGFLTPELLRVLRPGRVAAVHVKDRITPGGLSGFGFQTVSPFSDHAVAHFRRHGFAFLGRKTVVTDVVRENSQTNRLGWTEQCKDGSRMGAGLPEYVLLFRKPPTDRSNGYADTPVVKDKAAYSRSRWQVDAHGFMRSGGNRLLSVAELVNLPADAVFKIFRDHGLTNVYDFEQHVELGEALEAAGRLPKTFMLLQPPSWHPDVWTDVARMRTLNAEQVARGREMHLCPLQTDIADRLINQFSMPGETVFDPFAGIGTVPARAVRLRRRGLGIELNAGYFADAIGYCEAEARKVAVPMLFDLLEQGAA